MKTMNGITNELGGRKSGKNWRTRCSAFLLGALATLCCGHVFGEVVITTGPGRGLPQNWAFAITPTPPANPGQNAGNATVPGSQTQYTWTGVNGDGTYNSLNYLAGGMYVNYTDADGVLHEAVSGDGWQLNSFDSLSFINDGGQVTFYNNLTWYNTGFSVAGGATATVNARNNSTLSLGGQLNNAGVINLVGGTTGGTLSVGGNNASNSGLITVGARTVLELTGSLGGGGTIQGGRITVSTNNVSQHIDGGRISVAGATTLNGYLSGNITLTGGGSARIAADNTGNGPNGALSGLTVLSDTVARITSQENIGNVRVSLGGGGTLAKHQTAGDVTINNAINVGAVVAGETSDDSDLFYEGGGFSSYATSIPPWNENADSMHDAGRRFTVAGTISSTYLNSAISINAPNYLGGGSPYGTVVLTNGNTYTGSFNVYDGVLEITDESCLGQTNLGGKASDVNHYSVNLGGTGGGDLSARPTFRVVGAQQTDQKILHAIGLNTTDATYEVFTTVESVDDDSGSVTRNVDPQITTLRDFDRFTVHQAGLVSGANDLNKAGDGVLSLDCANNYTGDTVIWHGVLRIASAESINNNANAKIYIGGITGYETTNFRPVFETTLGSWDTNTVVINASVLINQTNSIIRTTGLGNETLVNGKIGTEYISGYSGAYAQYDAILNKDGAGTLTLHGTNSWGAQGAGELVINQGVVQFTAAKNLSKGYITIGTDWNTYKDIEIFDNNDATKGVVVPYQAVFRLEDNCGDVAIGNQIYLAAPRDPANPEFGAYIDVGTGSKLTLTAPIQELATANGSDLNKKGAGELVLSGTSNNFTGWTKVFSGTLTTSSDHNLRNSLGVDLIGNGTMFKLDGADQTIQNLRGVDPQQAALAPSDWNPKLWTRTVDIGSQKLTVNTTLANTQDAFGNTIAGNLLHGNIISDGGTLIMDAKITNGILAAGFIGFNGNFQIDSGRIQTLTDTTLTGLEGKRGTTLDVYGKTLTVDINKYQQYDGAIISTWPVLTNSKSAADYGTLIKDGGGDLRTSFQVVNNGNAVTTQGFAFNGSVVLMNGNIISDSDFTMAKDCDMTFYVNTKPDGSVVPLVFDIYGDGKAADGLHHTANFSAPTNLNVYLGDISTGWDVPTGRLVVGQIRGNDRSNYSGLTPADFNSLFYGIGTEEITGVGQRHLNILMNVTGFDGVGGSFNQRAVGHNLDGIRVTDLSGNPQMAEVIKQLWETGSNLQSEEERNAAIAKIRGVYEQLSGDVIANATFMGLDSPWKRPFDRLNLDSQMVYVHPQRQVQRGQMIANMRNLWFTPTYQGVVARSDGNARGFKIERPGYQLGWDKRVAQNASLGLMLGYSSPTLHQNQDIVNCSDFQVGLYGGAMVGYYVEVKGYIGFGHQNFKSSRTIDLRSIGLSTQTGHATFDGDTFNFSLEVARPLFLGFAVLRPTIGLDSEHAFRYGFQESGDSVALRYERSSISRTRARFGLSLETCTLERAIFSGRLGYSALLGGQDYAQTTAQFVNAYAAPQTIRSVAVGKSYFDAGVGCRYFLNPSKTLSLVADYDASVANRWAEHRGVVGFVFVY